MGYNKILEKMKAEGVKLPEWAKPNIEFYSPSPSSAQWSETGPVDQYNTSHNKMQKVEKPEHLYRLPAKRNPDDPRVASNDGASLLDIGNGVALLNFHTKMNALDDKILEMTQTSVALVNDRRRYGYSKPRPRIFSRRKPCTHIRAYQQK